MMPRIADALERESRTVDLEQGGFERLLARRERRLRNRRIREGVVAVIVALAAAAALARTIAWERTPAVPPKPVGAGEVLIGVRTLAAQDPYTGEPRTIVEDEAIPSRADDITGAAWSPDRAWVAFQAGGLWVADTIGGAPHQLSAEQSSDPWAWSPAGDRLAFVHGRGVILFDAATGDETDLGTAVADDGSEGQVAHSLVWSPDGTRIAFDGRPGGGSVYSIDVETGEHTLLVHRPPGTGEIKDIDWSQEGTLAVSYLDASYIASHRDELGPIAYKAKVLYLANADGSNVRLLDHVVASEWPVWTPGMSVGTGPSTGAAAWSPDGTRLVYTTISGGDHRHLQVWMVSANGSDPSMVASRCCMSDGGGPVWSPDGSQIAFEAEYKGDTPHEYPVVNADGTGDPTEIDELMYRSWAGGWYFCRCYG
jgi:Tol biopolymer transport system component